MPVDAATIEARLALTTAQFPGGGEPRPQQVQMALAVGEAIASRRHLVVQAGTGTGKSLAYLIPALLNGVKTVVATATKALQDQLATKDLPFLAAHLGIEVDFAVLKGRSNYLCMQRAKETSELDEQALDLPTSGSGARLGAEIKDILAWAASSPTGDRSELAFEPDPRVWSQLSVSATECPGAAKCPSGGVCFAEAARQRAEDAAVVIVNTHLYGAHLHSGGHVLPDHDVVIFDEAHELEDIAASSLGLEIGAGRLRALGSIGRTIDRAVSDEVFRAGDVLERDLTPHHGALIPRSQAIESSLMLCADRVSRLVAAARKAGDDDPRKARAMQAGGHLAADLGVVQRPGPEDVVWVEGPPHAPVLRMAPVDVGERLAECLWPKVTAILTSATIPPHMAQRLAIPNCVTLDVGSPFAHREQALLYCAAHLPDPRRPTFQDAAQQELVSLINAAGGRTLALFTSWKAMESAAIFARENVAYRILTQSDLPKPALLSAFTADETSCLFATMGFWQGVDVAGSTLSLVVIDKIPFPRPNEPLHQARRNRAGPNVFQLVDIPLAATLLAQGVGRLIRTANDRGVVAVLDPRLATAGYRREILNALPPMRRTINPADVAAFLAAGAP